MQKRVQDKKDLVARAAIKVIAREGFHNATVDKIASSAGVAGGTVYNYFLNKNDILDFIFQQEYHKRKAYFEKLKQEDLHPLETIKRILSMHFEEVKKNPDVFLVLLREKGMPKSCYFEGIHQFEGMPYFIADILRKGMESGALRSCKLHVIAPAIMGSIEALMARYLLEVEEKGSSTLLDAAAEEIALLLWQGLHNPQH